MSHGNGSYYYNKSQNIENAKKVIDFYHEVLKEFTFKLEKEFRYKGIITTQQIQNMELIVNQRLGQPAVLFEKTLKMKEGTKTEQEIRNQFAANREPELKQEYDEDNVEYKRVDEVNQKPKESDQDEDFDDVADFYEHIKNKNEIPFPFKSSKSDGEVKKEDNDNVYIENKVPESEKEIKEQEQDSDNESDAQNLTIEQCLENLNSIVLSTFSAPTLKHKPKQQKITVTLDNTFLKSIFNEFFIGSVNVDINKIERSDIRKDFPKKK